ncbi:hypothetical protein EVAR_18380_1 [Eumeta japonica]|uniref:Uncharacterized protein n=1 Tax=Eumeta variegata TaxID=151549 RepID=A0A4C1UUJ2_EUMVA|nr:hypothetical protein EVAR_18380_1 [Eumeta japonica]
METARRCKSQVILSLDRALRSLDFNPPRWANDGKLYWRSSRCGDNRGERVDRGGVDHRKSRSLDEIQQRKLLIHACILWECGISPGRVNSHTNSVCKIDSGNDCRAEYLENETRAGKTSLSLKRRCRRPSRSGARRPP